MSLRPPIPQLEPASPEEARGGWVFAGMMVLMLLAVCLPELNPQILMGLIWAMAGLIMVLAPPQFRIPRLWCWLAVGFVVAGAAGFLPRSWISLPTWRQELEALGLDTGTRIFVQPLLAFEGVLRSAVAALIAIYLLGHRTNTAWHRNLLLGFSLAVGAWTLAALLAYQPDSLKPVFGFFPNRNHTATLMVLGTFAGLGSLVQAIRLRKAWRIVLSIPPIGICLFALLAVSVSRSGVVLLAIGFLGWIPLAGLRQLGGHAGKAVLLLIIALVGTFLITETKVKGRLTETLEVLDDMAGSANDPRGGMGVVSATPGGPSKDLSVDGRLTIFKDTFTMVGSEPWTGVGPGQFQVVFPHYRKQTTASNDSYCLHPESGWLKVLAESGWASALCLLALVGLVCSRAVQRAVNSRARPMRMAGAVAGMLVCVQACIDVPAHRVGLALASVILIAMTFRSSRGREIQSSMTGSWWTGCRWRAAGLVPLVGGLVLLLAAWQGKPLLPSVKVADLSRKVNELCEADRIAYQRAAAAGREYQPEPSGDPLVLALELLSQALEIAPLNPKLHFSQGALALHIGEREELGSRAFAINRRLIPSRVNLPLEQALSWLAADPKEVSRLWQEAMRRAAVEEKRQPGSPFGIASTYHRILRQAGKNEALAVFTLSLADRDPALLVLWAMSAPPPILDRELPRMIKGIKELDVRQALFGAWLAYGSRQAATQYASEHPELGLAVRN